MCCVYRPTKELSLDESMVLWRGRLVFRQCIKNKRHKYGIKFDQLCQSNGIVLRATVYSGERFTYEHNLGQTASIVLHLMKDFLNKGYCVYADNYYNSVQLTRKLSVYSTYICGTLRFDRKEDPKEVISKKRNKGEFDWRRNGTIVVSKWRDKRDVLTISNMHSGKIMRVANRHGQVMFKPNIVSDYNKGMAGVYRSDQMLSYYPALRKTIRWYKKLALILIEMYLFNVHKFYFQSNPPSKMRLLEFREHVVISLIGNTAVFHDHYTEIKNHFPTSIPPTKKKKFPTKQCRVCTKSGIRRESRYICGACNLRPALCVDPCFRIYHSS